MTTSENGVSPSGTDPDEESLLSSIGEQDEEELEIAARQALDIAAADESVPRDGSLLPSSSASIPHLRNRVMEILNRLLQVDQADFWNEIGLQRVREATTRSIDLRSIFEDWTMTQRPGTGMAIAKAVRLYWQAVLQLRAESHWGERLQTVLLEVYGRNRRFRNPESHLRASRRLLLYAKALETTGIFTLFGLAGIPLNAISELKQKEEAELGIILHSDVVLASYLQPVRHLAQINCGGLTFSGQVTERPLITTRPLYKFTTIPRWLEELINPGAPYLNS